MSAPLGEFVSHAPVVPEARLASITTALVPLMENVPLPFSAPNSSAANRKPVLVPPSATVGFACTPGSDGSMELATKYWRFAFAPPVTVIVGSQPTIELSTQKFEITGDEVDPGVIGCV